MVFTVQEYKRCGIQSRATGEVVFTVKKQHGGGIHSLNAYGQLELRILTALSGSSCSIWKFVKGNGIGVVTGEYELRIRPPLHVWRGW